MSIELFDVQCGFGGMTPGDPAVISAEDLVGEMGRLQITTALARTAPEDHEVDVPTSNAALYAAHASHSSLIPCPVVVPDRGGDLPSEQEQIAAHIKQGSGAVCVRPSTDYWSLAPWVCDALFGALQERHMPVLCLERLVGLDQVGRLAERFRSLIIIIAEAGYRQQRVLLPLLETFPCVYLSIGNNYTVHLGIEKLVATVSAKRLLFGTGFPQAEAMAAVTQLMYADISDGDMQLIGAANMKRLIAGIER
jgi:hypothetical protein